MSSDYARPRTRGSSSTSRRSAGSRSRSRGSARSRRWRSKLTLKSAPRLGALSVAVVGALMVLAGGLQSTVFAPSALTVASLDAPRAPIVSTAVGVLGLSGPRVAVEATGTSARRPVFLGIGRARDVDAYLAQASLLEVTGHDGDGALVTQKRGTDATLPDPAAADVWVVSARGQGRGKKEIVEATAKFMIMRK